MINCIFCKIASREISVSFVAENDSAVAFYDRSPQAPVHILVIPRAHIASINDLTDQSGPVIVGMMDLVRQLAQIHGNSSDKGFNLKVNTGASAGQEIFHMHWHFLAGK